MTLSFSLLALLACGTAEVEAPAEAPTVEEAAEVEGAEAHDAEAATEVAKGGHYGAEFTLTDSAPLQTLIDDPTPHVGKNVRVTGEVTTVCQKAGCWMVLRAQDGESVRVTMKEHSFSVAKDCAGSTAHVEGTVVEKAVDPDTVAHFASETEEGGEVPETGKDRVLEIVATAVQVEN